MTYKAGCNSHQLPICPVKSEAEHTLYRRRNEIERLFRRLKAFRRIFSRFDKLDVMFTAFIHFALIAEALRPQLV